MQAAAPQRRLQLDLHEHAAQVGTPAAHLPQLAQQRAPAENRGLALREQLDRELHFALAEPELAHHRARRADLVLGDAAVGLGEMAHDLERGAEERLLAPAPDSLPVAAPIAVVARRPLSACTSNRCPMNVPNNAPTGPAANTPISAPNALPCHIIDAKLTADNRSSRP